MRATLVRSALLAAFVGIAAPAAAQRSGPCPPGPISVSAGPRATAEPIECLFAPNGEIRAALYPATVFESSTRVHVFRDDAGYRSSLSGHPDEVLTVPRVNRFSDLDRTTLEQIEGTAEVQESTPDGARLRLASYAPTTPSTQSGTADVRVISRGYDDFDRLSNETVQLQDGSTVMLSYTYWNNGERKTVTDAVGRVTFYEYDGRNRLSRLTANQGLPDERVTTYAYWPDSLLKSVTKPDGTVTSYGYDRAARLKSIAVRKGDTELLSYAYVYDGNGNRTEQVERNGGAPETTTYTYDDLNRLETVTYSDGRQVAYGYDAVGNRTAETERDPAGTVTSATVAVFDRTNRLSTVTDTVNPANNATFAYDSNGNVERKTTATGAETYAYDVRDHLVETRAGASITGRFAYDAFGRRYLKIGSEGLRQYLYDQTSLLEEFSDANTEVAKYDWAADRLVSLARLEEPRRFFHFDALGSVVALTEESGSVAARYHYDAWGRHRDPAELDASANRFGFTGHYFDTETKLYYAKARYFDPDFGRFLTQDSYLGEIGDPPSLNRYLYANANPTRYVDQDGHSATAIGTVVGFVWGAAQMVGGGIDDLRTGRQRTTGEYLSIWAQNTIGGAAVGASIDLGLASGGLALSASGALGAAGYEALSVGGEGQAWSQLGKNAGTAAAIGAVAGPAMAKAAPVVGAVAGKIPGVGAAGRWIAGQAGEVAEGIANRYVRTEADELLAQPFTQVLESASQLPTKAREGMGQLLRRAGAETAEATGSSLPIVAGGSQGADMAFAESAAAIAPTRAAGRSASGVERLAGSKLEHMNAAIAEQHGYEAALEKGHIGIQEPGKVTEKGLDYATYDRKAGDIVVWDSKYRGPNGGSAPATIPTAKLQRWMPELRSAIEAMPDGPIKAEILSALDAGRVRGQVFKWPQ